MNHHRVELDSTRKVLLFDCPGCTQMHAIRVAPRDGGSLPGDGPVWTWNGSLEKPSVQPSLLVRWTEGEARTPMVCHSFIADGRIQFLGDCTHPLAGQTVDLPETS